MYGKICQTSLTFPISSVNFLIMAGHKLSGIMFEAMDLEVVCINEANFTLFIHSFKLANILKALISTGHCAAFQRYGSEQDKRSPQVLELTVQEKDRHGDDDSSVVKEEFKIQLGR